MYLRSAYAHTSYGKIKRKKTLSRLFGGKKARRTAVKSRGLTLIEWLIVIVVIAIVALLVFSRTGTGKRLMTPPELRTEAQPAPIMESEQAVPSFPVSRVSLFRDLDSRTYHVITDNQSRIAVCGKDFSSGSYRLVFPEELGTSGLTCCDKCYGNLETLLALLRK